MKKPLLIIIVAVIIIIFAGIAYKLYKQNRLQNTSTMTQTSQQEMQPSPTATDTANPNAVDQTSSPQEQQVQQNLNSLDSGDTN